MTSRSRYTPASRPRCVSGRMFAALRRATFSCTSGSTAVTSANWSCPPASAAGSKPHSTMANLRCASFVAMRSTCRSHRAGCDKGKPGDPRREGPGPRSYEVLVSNPHRPDEAGRRSADQRSFRPEDAELVALWIGQHRPGFVAGLADVHTPGPEGDDAVDLGLPVGRTRRCTRAEVEVNAVLRQLLVGARHEADTDRGVLVGADHDL